MSHAAQNPAVTPARRTLLDEEQVRRMLSRIAHKHVSLGISAEQYKIVHRHLFAAIGEVLGAAVTPEVAAAWDEVYWLMAETLIGLEAALYRNAGVAEGEVWQNMEIAERLEQTPDAITLVLRRPDGRPPGAFRPGQYISVQIPLPDGARQIRQYSLSAAPGRRDWRITVKRVPAEAVAPAGEVSAHLHAHAQPGDLLTVSVPGGDLVLDEGDGPVLLASAGIGVTPMLAMLDHLAETGSARRVTVLHADRTPADHAHAADQRRLVAALPATDLRLWYEHAPDGLPEGAALGRTDLAGIDLPEGVTAYLCGPLPFMRALRAGLTDFDQRPPSFDFQGSDVTFTPAPGALPFALSGAKNVEFHLRAGPDNEGGVFAVAFSPDGQRLTTAGYDGIVRTYDLTAGGKLAGAFIPVPLSAKR